MTKTTFFKSQRPIVSDRVKIIINNKKDLNVLVIAIREVRNGDTNATFKISDESVNKIKKLKK